MKNKLTVNIIASMMALGINLLINLCLNPYIVNTIGLESYGFIALGNDFINYANLLTIALNSMAARFITIEVHKNNYKKANQFFSSIMICNVLMATILLIPFCYIVLNINQFVQVPNQILKDVQILWGFLFFNFLFTLITNAYGVVYFTTNNLYINSKRQIESQFIRVVLICGLFMILTPHIWYLGLISLVINIYIVIFNVYYTSKLVPELKFNCKDLNISAIKELLSSGIWNTITRLGTILLEGLDLVIANIFIGASAMGILALAKTIPNIINMIIGTLSGNFLPHLTKLYVEEDMEEFVSYTKQAMKLMGLIINVPIAGFIIFGDVFFTLWVPTQDAKLLHILAIIILLPFAIMGPVTIIHNIFTVANKLKVNSILLVITGIINSLMVILLLNITSWGVFVVVGLSVIFSVIRNLLYTVPFGAIYTGNKWYTYFPTLFKSILSVTSTLIVGLLIRISFGCSNWGALIGLGVLTAIISIIINIFIMYNKKERKDLKRIIVKKLTRS